MTINSIIDKRIAVFKNGTSLMKNVIIKVVIDIAIHSNEVILKSCWSDLKSRKSVKIEKTAVIKAINKINNVLFK